MICKSYHVVRLYNQLRHSTTATHFWRLFTLVELSENMRKNEPVFSILSALQVGEYRAEQICILMQKVSVKL